MKLISVLTIFGYLIILRPFIIRLSLLISASGIIIYVFLRNRSVFANRILLVSSLLSLIPYLLVGVRFMIYEVVPIVRSVLNERLDFIEDVLARLWIIKHDPIFWGISVSGFALGLYLVWSRRGPKLMPLNDELLSNMIARVSKELRISVPEIYVERSERVQLYTNASKTKPYVVITTAALKMLTMEEISAAIAHELAHIRNEDRDSYFLSLVSTIGTVFNFLNLLNPLLLKRDSEYAADEIAARTVGVEPLIKALLKVSDIAQKPILQSGFVPSRFEIFSLTPSIKSRIMRLIRLYNEGKLPRFKAI
ncbi:MAG: M48 family metalloprotease [Nitrososphaeria archaeon]